MSNLILGELAHAMPHMAQHMDHAATAMNEAVMSASTSQDSPPCASHVQADSESGKLQGASSDEAATKDCCKGGICACPCLHSPAATAAVPFVMHLTHDDQVAVLIDGATAHRLSGLFRPPA